VRDRLQIARNSELLYGSAAGVRVGYWERAGGLGGLSYLAPDIIEAILDGRQPRDLTADKLLAHSRLPLAWHEQRTVLGFA
jgi:hypothetical protein